MKYIKILIFFLNFSRRAKQEGTENDEDNHPTTNGFVPIEQAVKNAEKKSTS